MQGVTCSHGKPAPWLACVAAWSTCAAGAHLCGVGVVAAAHHHRLVLQQELDACMAGTC